ncbi:MAG: hypothetical protein AAF493_18490 [Pseudomonadota bacterium]
MNKCNAARLWCGLTLLIASLAASAMMNNYESCVRVNKAAAAETLDKYSDKKVRNELCAVWEQREAGIVAHDRIKEKACTRATEHLKAILKTRFPKTEPDKHLAHC